MVDTFEKVKLLQNSILGKVVSVPSSVSDNRHFQVGVYAFCKIVPDPFTDEETGGTYPVERVVPVFRASRPGILYAKSLAYAAKLAPGILDHLGITGVIGLLGGFAIRAYHEELKATQKSRQATVTESEAAALAVQVSNNGSVAGIY